MLPPVLGAGLVLLFATVQVALVNTLGLFLLVTLIGLWQCRATAYRLADTKLRVLGTLWLVKVGLTLLLLYAGWIPQFDPASSDSWGYDAQRFYQDAYDLIENGWNPVTGLNYQGITFHYGAIFYLFGHNPVIPALVNAFITLLGTLFFIRCAYGFAPNRTSKDWWIAGLLLVPEVLWYDVITSCESLATILILVAAFTASGYLVGVRMVNTLLLSGTAFVATLTLRRRITKRS